MQYLPFTDEQRRILLNLAQFYEALRDAERGALVLVGEPTFPGCRIRARPVGVFHMTDEKGPDEKVLFVPLKDTAWMRVHDIHDIPPEFRDEIEHFFQVYKTLEAAKKTATHGFGNRAEAVEIIRAGYERKQAAEAAV